MIEIKGQSIADKIKNSDNFYDYFNEYKGTNNNRAIELFDNVLDEYERECLLEILFGTHGWYIKKQETGFYKLKFTSWTLDFTNSNLFHAEAEQKRLQEIFENIESKELDILKSVYIKQKLITYKTLRNLKYNDKIILYRGIKYDNEMEKYWLGNLESWTDDKNKAVRFTGNDGYVLQKEFSLEDIFLCYKSVYKTNEKPKNRVRKMIKIEKEFIVENNETILNKENLYRYKGGVFYG